MDIIEYLTNKKGMSVEDIAKAMSVDTDHIKQVKNKKKNFTPDDINSYLKSQNQRFWEFAIEVIPLEHLSDDSRKRILLCKELSDHIKKSKKKF